MTLPTYKAILRSGVAILAVAWGSTAWAQTKSFDVPADVATNSIPDLARQAGIQIVAPADQLTGVKTPAVKGSLELHAALADLLKGTGLQIASDNGQTIMLKVTPKNVQAAQNEGAAKVTVPMESVIVTGTSIRGTSPIGSNVLTYTRSDIDQSGGATLDQFARQMPQNFTGADSIAIAPNNNANFGRFTQGAGTNIFGGATFNLNGLGAGSTLTLLDGHRLAPGGFDGSLVDISEIPLSAIGHIEVLDDGASAIYGSDAVAGVVNIITRDNFDGAETTARYGTSTQGGATETNVSQLIGHSWSSGNIMADYEYDDQQGLDASQRNWIPTQGGPFSLLPENVRNSVFASGRQDISDDTNISGDVLYSDRNFKNSHTLKIPSSEIDQDQSGHARQTAASLVLDHTFLSDWHASLSGNYSSMFQLNDENIHLIFPAFNINETELEKLSSATQIAEGSAVADGTLFSLPGGDVKAAVGGDYRFEQYKGYETTGGPVTPNALSRNVWGAHAEVSVPLIGSENAQAWAQTLAISAAVRYDNYSDFGSTTNPKVGIEWEPDSDLRLRGSYSTSFQAPFLSQLGMPIDYVAGYVPNASAPGGQSDVLEIGGGNPNLRPQTARSETGGFDYHPNWVPGLTLTATYFHIAFSDRIQTPNTTSTAIFAQPILAPFITRNPPLSLVQSDFLSPGFEQDQTGLGPAGVAAIFDEQLANIASTVESGLNFSAAYDVPTAIGKFDLSLQGTDILSDSLRTLAGAPSFSIVNTFDEPTKWKLRGGLGWSNYGFTSRLSLNYVGSYQNTLPTAPQPIDAWTTVDFNLSYDTGSALSEYYMQGVKLAFNVQNLFDLRPPYVQIPSSALSPGQNPVPFDGTNASPVGRLISIQLTKSF